MITPIRINTKNTVIKMAGIRIIAIVFCSIPEVLNLGSHLSNLKNLQKKVKKFVTKTGTIKRVFSFLVLDFRPRNISEVPIAKNEGKSRYHANAMLETKEVTNNI
jgi:hypothetical protein